MRKTLLAVLIAGAMVSGVQAAESHVNGYLFGHVGQADYDTGSFYSGVPGSLDEKDTAFKIGAGVQLNSYVGIEFQYVDLGDLTFKTAGFRTRDSADGLGANLVATLPLDRFKLYGKVGYHKMKYEVTEKDGFGSWNESEKEWVTSYAIGATLALTPAFEIVAEYERYQDVADNFNGSGFDADVDLASIGLRYNF